MYRTSLVIGGFLASLIAVGEPINPQRDDVVLERLPRALVGNSLPAKIRKLRAALAADPRNADTAASLAWHFIQLGRTTGDSRYIGYAQGALTPWWNHPSPPAKVLLPRATIKQNRHQFVQALSDLDRLVRLQPRDAQAWLTKSVIHLVRGEFQASQFACHALLKQGYRALTVTCIAEVLARTGRAAEAQSLLAELLAEARRVERPERIWALTASAEIAARLGHIAEADRRFREGLALRTRNVYLLTAYADFLLDQGKDTAVTALLAGESQTTTLLLRLAIAERRLGDSQHIRHREILRRRFEAERARGGSGHPGNEARFLHHLTGRPDLALPHAQAQWESQKEPDSARLLLEVARAAGKKSAAAGVLEWLELTGIEDTRLRAVAAGFRGTDP